MTDFVSPVWGKWEFPAAGQGTLRELLLHLCSSQGSEAARRSTTTQRDSRSNQDITETGAAQIPASRFDICSAAIFKTLCWSLKRSEKDQLPGGAVHMHVVCCACLHCRSPHLLFSDDMRVLPLFLQQFRDLLLLFPRVAEGWTDVPALPCHLPVKRERLLPGFVTALAGRKGLLVFFFLCHGHYSIKKWKIITNTVMENVF